MYVCLCVCVSVCVFVYHVLSLTGYKRGSNPMISGQVGDNRVFFEMDTRTRDNHPFTLVFLKFLEFILKLEM